MELQFGHLVTGGVLEMHVLHSYASIQAGSQFNCLEFSSFPAISEDGINGFAADMTQGSAYPLACAPGTLYRNYFSLEHEQSTDRQINSLDQLEIVF